MIKRGEYLTLNSKQEPQPFQNLPYLSITKTLLNLTFPLIICSNAFCASPNGKGSTRHLMQLRKRNRLLRIQRMPTRIPGNRRSIHNQRNRINFNITTRA